MTLPPSSLDALAADYAERTWLDVRPRHHAGPGDARHITHGLAAAGWTRRSDPLGPHLVLQSPDHRFGLEMSTGISSGGLWWWLCEHPTATNGWWAEFGDTPVEILGHVTDALVLDPPPPERCPSPLNTLAEAGWAVTAKDAVSPERCCHFARTTAMWSVRTYGAPSRHAPLVWHATLHPRTPQHVLAALAAGLADTAPLHRSTWDRTGLPSLRPEPSTLTATQIIGAHKDRVHALGTRWADSRSRAGVAPPPATSRSTSARAPRVAHAG
ncbi:DUF317 domain-containing protein [Streptomyces sp. GZWMJZ-114]|uniref:DUF317 domain-containing protein n=1 Tax=Streptomyces sp. GZWMJZ-114 TaxID=2494734 RepID=UPI0013E98BCF|nr:DUF317 domain-containing protein [Streptomyces sp. GZWMJZ-114]